MTLDADEEAALNTGSDDDLDDDGASSLDPLRPRKIPTWDETIGILVQANMDSRARNPNAGRGYRGGDRGRRGGHRGGDRGERGGDRGSERGQGRSERDGERGGREGPRN